MCIDFWFNIYYKIKVIQKSYNHWLGFEIEERWCERIHLWGYLELNDFDHNFRYHDLGGLADDFGFKCRRTRCKKIIWDKQFDKKQACRA